MHEIIQGIYRWKDFNLEKTPPLGIIPGGSGDALSKTLLFDSIEQFSIENAFWLLVKGQIKRVDIIELTNSSID